MDNQTFKKVSKVAWIIIFLGLAVLVGFRIDYFNKLDATNAQIEKIHATKLTLADVMGDNLPPDPGEQADTTIAGVDANYNGIRDDVELAIFEKYPNSAKTRAVLLQYALALQMEMIQPFINTDIVIAVAQDTGRAYVCVGYILSRDNMEKFIEEGKKLHEFIESRQLNTEVRKKTQHDFYQGNLKSYSSLPDACDLDLSTLPN